MNIEYEVKYWVDHQSIIKKLQNLGGVCIHPKRLMKRYIFTASHLPVGTWIRVRDEGDQVTLSVKSFNGMQTIDSVKELEVIVSDFDTSVLIFKTLGYQVWQQAENYREVWQLGNCLIMLDTWPWLNEFIELEASSESVVRYTADQLRLTVLQPHYGTTKKLYQYQYGLTDQQFDGIREFTFSLQPDWVKQG